MALSGRRPALALFGAFVLIAAIVAPATASTSGPTSLSSTTTTTAPSPPVLRSDATVTIAVSHLPRELNPWATHGDDPLVASIMAEVWPQASIVDSHGNSTICFVAVPNCPEPLFSSVEDISIQPQTVEYMIAPKARWSDGVLISAGDFIDLWHEVVARAATLPVTEPIAGYLDIASITSSARGSKITVVFKQPYADWPALFDYVPPSHISKKDGFDAAYASGNLRLIPSAGPYRISRIVPNRSIILDRNENFWGPNPSVKRIIFRVVKSQAAILAGLAGGSITLAELPPGPSVDRVVAGSTDLVEQTVSSPVLWQLAFNVANPSLTPAVVRQAIAKIVNRHELIANTVGRSIVFGRVSGNRLFPAGAPGSQGNDAAYGAVAPVQATALLSSVGDRLDHDGFVERPNGARLVLSLAVPRAMPTMSGIASEIQAELLTAGIGVTIHSVSLARLLSRTLPSGSYDMALVPYPVSAYPSTTASLYLDPVGPTPPSGVNPTASAPLGVSGSTPSTTSRVTTTSLAGGSTNGSALSILPPGTRGTQPAALAIGTATRNILGFSDPALKSLFAQASTQLNTASELSLYNGIDMALWADLPTLPLFQQPVDLVARSALLNVSQSSSLSQYLWNANNWAVEENPPPVTTTTVPSS